MMKVLWLAPIPLLDSSDSHPAPWIMTLAHALVDKGIELTILNYKSDINEKVLEMDYKNIKIVYIKTPILKIDFITLYKLRIYIVKKYLQKIIDNFDVLHIHGTEHQYEAISSELHIPKLISIQGIMSECIKFIPIIKYKQFLEWKLSSIYELKYIPKYYNFSCRTHWDSKYIMQKNPKAKVNMIWEMIREEFFKDHFSDKNEYLLFVGGKNSIKGLKELLIAYDRSIQDLGLKLIILGECSRKDIQNLIRKKQLKNISISNIYYRGMQDSTGMIKAFEESFCLIHPSYIDNSPNSICEAQISGLPVIATNVGGVSSLIEDKETGLLIGTEVKDIEIAVKLLFENHELRKGISMKSQILARERHNPETILYQTIEMYKEILSQ